MIQSGVDGEGSEVVFGLTVLGFLYGDICGVSVSRADMADAPRPPYIRLIFGLDMRGTGQPGRVNARPGHGFVTSQ